MTQGMRRNAQTLSGCRQQLVNHWQKQHRRRLRLSITTLLIQRHISGWRERLRSTSRTNLALREYLGATQPSRSTEIRLGLEGALHLASRASLVLREQLALTSPWPRSSIWFGTPITKSTTLLRPDPKGVDAASLLHRWDASDNGA